MINLLIIFQFSDLYIKQRVKIAISNMLTINMNINLGLFQFFNFCSSIVLSSWDISESFALIQFYVIPVIPFFCF